MSGSKTVHPEIKPVGTQNDTRITVQQDQSNNTNNQVSSGSLHTAEETFKAIHLHEATGWTILNPGACSPTLGLYPTIGVGPLVTQVPVRPWQIEAEPDCGCCCNCCCPKERGFRTYSMQSAGVEVMRFRYRPYLCLCACLDKRTVDIYISQKDERIGWIEFTGNFEEGSTITDGITGTVFTVSHYICDNIAMCLTVSDQLGNPMVSCQAIGGSRDSHRRVEWTTFAMEYLPPMANTALSSRAVLLVAFQMWVLMYVEKGTRCSITALWGLLLGLPLFFTGLFVGLSYR